MQTAPSFAARASSAKSANPTRLSREYSVCMCMSSRMRSTPRGCGSSRAACRNQARTWSPSSSSAKARTRMTPGDLGELRKSVEGVTDVTESDEAEHGEADEESEDPE